MMVSPSKKVTRPVAADGETVAVNVKAVPNVIGAEDEAEIVTEVLVNAWAATANRQNGASIARRRRTIGYPVKYLRQAV
jgi:hypothetical protein